MQFKSKGLIAIGLVLCMLIINLMATDNLITTGINIFYPIKQIIVILDEFVKQWYNRKQATFNLLLSIHLLGGILILKIVCIFLEQFFPVLKIESVVLYMLDTCFSTEIHPKPTFYFKY